MKKIDDILNRITMYRVVLYYLVGLWLVALIYGAIGVLPYHPADIIFSGLLILFVCWLTNEIFGDVFEAPQNVESVYITAFILALLITPLSVTAATFFEALWFVVWACVWSIAAKFIFAIRKKHIFNPAACGVAITALAIHHSATWWVGTAALLPFVIVGGLLVVQKVRRWDLVLSFFVTAFASIVLFGLIKGVSPLTSITKASFESPIFFFAFAMLTEPLTTPPTRFLRIGYGAFVGIFFSPAVHIGSLYLTPELALLAGNIFSYLVSPKEKLMLTLKEKKIIGLDLFDFSFSPDRLFSFQPGQYLEWTLAHKHPDSRGNRRYFTIASSPTERTVHMGVKFYYPSSSFKNALSSLQIGDRIIASQLAGDFILPKNIKQKLVLIAGGIGITPFRSMIRYLTDRNERRDIILLYSAKTPNELAYQDVFDAAGKVGIKTIYVVTDSQSISSGWNGKVGRITRGMLKEEIPDYQDRIFYLSGPRSLVVAFEQTLKSIGIHKKKIKTDFFPGFA